MSDDVLLGKILQNENRELRIVEIQQRIEKCILDHKRQYGGVKKPTEASLLLARGCLSGLYNIEPYASAITMASMYVRPKDPPCARKEIIKNVKLNIINQKKFPYLKMNIPYTHKQFCDARNRFVIALCVAAGWEEALYNGKG